jgi:L-ascorbate metabolism protein UlaG (beta-lactamase superfamily)
MTAITTWGHACVRFERDGRRLVIDPGTFSDPSVLDDADAVLITHEHVDHIEAGSLVKALGAHPGLEAWAPDGVVRQLLDAGAPEARIHAAADGDRFTAAGFAVRAVGQWHAVIHPDMPRVANVAYLIDGTALHPGDSFTAPADVTTVDLLFLPVSAPWLKVAEAVDYLRAVGPRVVVPIHDAILSDAGRALTDRVVGTLAGATEYRRLTPGESMTVSWAAG